MKSVVRTVVLCLGALPVAAQTPSQAPAKAPELPTLERFNAAELDKSVDPCVDFHQYACGGFFAKSPIPPDQVAWGKASPLQLWNETVLRQTLEGAAAKKEGRSPLEQQIGDYWSACMDEAGIEKAGLAPFQPQLQRIAALKSKAELVDELARIHASYPGAWQMDNNQTNTAVFGFGATQDFDDATKVLPQFDQAGMNLPGRDYYLSTDARKTELRGKYRDHVARMLILLGEPEAQARKDAADVVALETDLAKGAMEIVKRRDPKNLNNKMTLAQVQALVPSLDVKRYLTLVKAPAATTYLVTSPDFFKGLETMIQTHPLDHWKAYLRYTTAHYAAATLSPAILQENWDFYAHTLAGAEAMQPRWRRCVRAADRDLGEALGQAYTQRAFPPASKQQARDMVKAVEDALDQNITTMTWMTAPTKAKAREKLKLIVDKIGYPDHFRDYSKVRIAATSFPGNVAAATAFELDRWVQKIGKPVDRGEWQMTPPTINAYYDPQLNTINFPAGILQPPFFDPTQSPALSYGAIGGVMGHEIIHGFDDQGRKFDGQGNLRDWWTPEDTKAYDDRGKCISDEYTQELPEYGVKTNGLLTQGEDTADNGGIYLALLALEGTLRKDGRSLATKGEDGLTELQRFFVGYASAWCTQYRPEIARIVIGSDPHSLPKLRVNNVVGNMPEFAQAFACKAGQPMVRANACRVW